MGHISTKWEYRLASYIYLLTYLFVLQSKIKNQKFQELIKIIDGYPSIVVSLSEPNWLAFVQSSPHVWVYQFQ